MLNFVEHLTSNRSVIGVWCNDMAPYNIQMFRSVIIYFKLLKLLFIFYSFFIHFIANRVYIFNFFPCQKIFIPKILIFKLKNPPDCRWRKLMTLLLNKHLIRCTAHGFSSRLFTAQQQITLSKHFLCLTIALPFYQT